MIPYLLGPGQHTEFKHSKRIARFRQCSDVVSLDTAHPQPSHALTVMCNFQTRLLAATVEVQLFHKAHVVHIVCNQLTHLVGTGRTTSPCILPHTISRPHTNSSIAYEKSATAALVKPFRLCDMERSGKRAWRATLRRCCIAPRLSCIMITCAPPSSCDTLWGFSLR